MPDSAVKVDGLGRKAYIVLREEAMAYDDVVVLEDKDEKLVISLAGELSGLVEKLDGRAVDADREADYDEKQAAVQARQRVRAALDNLD